MIVPRFKYAWAGRSKNSIMFQVSCIGFSEFLFSREPIESSEHDDGRDSTAEGVLSYLPDSLTSLLWDVSLLDGEGPH